MYLIILLSALISYNSFQGIFLTRQSPHANNTGSAHFLLCSFHFFFLSYFAVLEPIIMLNNDNGNPYLVPDLNFSLLDTMFAVVSDIL